MKMQMEPLAARNATSPFENSSLCFSTPILIFVKRVSIAPGDTIALEASGNSSRRAVTVTGARWRYSPRVNFPLPLIVTEHSTLETDKLVRVLGDSVRYLCDGGFCFLEIR